MIEQFFVIGSTSVYMLNAPRNLLKYITCNASYFSLKIQENQIREIKYLYCWLAKFNIQKYDIMKIFWSSGPHDRKLSPVPFGPLAPMTYERRIDASSFCFSGAPRPAHLYGLAPTAFAHASTLPRAPLHRLGKHGRWCNERSAVLSRVLFEHFLPPLARHRTHHLPYHRS